ncbi:MAG TPA: beta-L-arabinofuranosidase domain-containing protein, partial [Terracidiphilus sp.]
MSHNLSRRKFLGGAAATGAATLLTSSTAALAAGSAAQAAGKGPAQDVENHFLTDSPVEKVQWKAKPFPMPDVRLLPGFWKGMSELNRSWLYSLPNERLAHNFRVNAGIASDADPLGGWEAPDIELRGHYVGHYLSSCALMHASTGDQVIATKAN